MNTFLRFSVAFLFMGFSSCVTAKEKIRIYAAASTTNVVNELIDIYSRKNDVDITPIFASTSSLAHQIERGAPAGIFISANIKWMDYLVNKEVVDKQRVQIVAYNELVLIASKIKPQQAFKLDDVNIWTELLKNERLAIGQPNSVPVGIYARQAFQAMGVWNVVKKRTAPANSVRVALALVERNEAPLGVVYNTDAKISDKVTIVARFPKESHKPVTYPMVTLTNDKATNAFAEFIVSDTGRSVFHKYGFK